MALKIGSKKISTSAPIEYNGRGIKKVFVKGNPRTVSTSDTIPPSNKQQNFTGWETIDFTFDGDVRSWSRSMSFSCSQKDAYTASITAVSYNSTSNITTFTATIKNASGLLHTTAYSYTASITISLTEKLVWECVVGILDPVVVVSGYYNIDTDTTDINFTVTNVYNKRAAKITANITWWCDASSLNSKSVETTNIIKPGGEWSPTGSNLYTDPDITDITVYVAIYYEDGASGHTTESITINDLQESTGL